MTIPQEKPFDEKIKVSNCLPVVEKPVDQIKDEVSSADKETDDE